MAGFADELGQIAAQAIRQKELAYEREEASLAAKMWGEWAGRVGIREKAREAASRGQTHFDFRFDAKQYGFKEFKPKRDDVVSNLPWPLKAEWESKKLRISHGTTFPDYLEFECSLKFHAEADTHLATIKRQAEATDAKDTAAPPTKKVKSEVKSEVKAEPQ